MFSLSYSVIRKKPLSFPAFFPHVKSLKAHNPHGDIISSFRFPAFFPHFINSDFGIFNFIMLFFIFDISRKGENKANEIYPQSKIDPQNGPYAILEGFSYIKEVSPIP
jgi:hypothetical protein